MKTKTLQSRQWVPYSFEEVVRLFKNPNNLGVLTPPEFEAEISCDGRTEEDAQVIISTKPPLSPIRIKWVSKIQNVEESDTHFQFQDIQLSGPFAHWLHTHRIEKATESYTGRSGKIAMLENPGTWIIDDVEYVMPFSIFGRIAEKLFARNQLEDMFYYRKDATLQLLEKMRLESAQDS